MRSALTLMVALSACDSHGVVRRATVQSAAARHRTRRSSASWIISESARNVRRPVGRRDTPPLERRRAIACIITIVSWMPRHRALTMVGSL
jgi:hypothetical protein